MDFAFPQFLPFFQKNVETNDTSFESPKTELLESGEKVGVALSWSWPHPPNKKHQYTKQHTNLPPNKIWL